MRPLISSRYLSTILKHVIKAAESDRHEVNEHLILMLASSLAPSPPSEWTYRTYTYGIQEEDIDLDVILTSLGHHQSRIEPILKDVFPHEHAADESSSPSLHHVTLRVSENILGGSTGFNAWEAGFIMAEWILNQDQDFFSQSDILELGCGLGLTGICLARNLSKGSKIFLTDGNPKVVASAEHNLQLNGTCKCDEGVVSCKQLLWGPISAEGYFDLLNRGQGSTRPLIVLAADVLYDPFLYPQLISLLSSLLDHSETTQTECRIYIFTTLRQEESFIDFMGQSHKRGLYVENSVVRGMAPSSLGIMQSYSSPKLNKTRFFHRLNPLEVNSVHEPPIILSSFSQ